MCGTHRSDGVAPVELLMAARSGHVRRPGGACHPFAHKREKGAADDNGTSDRWCGYHADSHVAAAVDHNGGLLGVESFGADLAGYEDLVGWLAAFGPVERVGVEGTGSWGVALARFLAAAGVETVEVDRPNRQARRKQGKSDATDAVAAARAVLTGKRR